MKTITEIFDEHNDRQTSKWVHYLEIYERHFCKFVGTSVKVLEIGVEDGGSLQMWKKYFGKNCEITGIDTLPKCKYEEEQIRVEIGSQNDINFLQEIDQKYGPFDIIIDDGSHIQMDVLNTFSFLYPKLNMGGVYIIEDLHTAYFQGYGGGITSPFNFISILSKYIHDVNVDFIQEPYTTTLMNIKSINFYNSMVVLEKTNNEKIYSTYSGRESKNGEVQFTPEMLKHINR